MSNAIRSSVTDTNRFGKILTAVLIALVAAGGTLACSRYHAGLSTEITLTEDYPQSATQEEIYIGGNVVHPGYYPLYEDDSIESLIQSAGGTIDDASDAVIKFYVNSAAAETAPQKIDLNHAEKWLLEALPGIGAERAEAIISYRIENGPFRCIEELLKVSGIGEKTFDDIKDLITVSD